MIQLFLKVFKILDIIIPSEVILKETDYYKEDPSLTHISKFSCFPHGTPKLIFQIK